MSIQFISGVSRSGFMDLNTEKWRYGEFLSLHFSILCVQFQGLNASILHSVRYLDLHHAQVAG